MRALAAEPKLQVRLRIASGLRKLKLQGECECTVQVIPKQTCGWVLCLARSMPNVLQQNSDNKLQQCDERKFGLPATLALQHKASFGSLLEALHVVELALLEKQICADHTLCNLLLVCCCRRFGLPGIGSGAPSDCHVPLCCCFHTVETTLRTVLRTSCKLDCELRADKKVTS